MTKAKIINGKAIADEIRKEARDQIAKLNIKPCLAVILAGDDPASHLYVSIKKKAAENAGIEMSLYNFEEDVKQESIIKTIEFLNKDEEVDAILIQLPLPNHLDEDAIIRAIDPEKDADGFHPENIKKILSLNGKIFSPLNMGILQLITSTKENLENKTAVIIARSKEFTSTLSRVLDDFGIRAQIVNPDSSDAKRSLSSADIIISAVGKPKWITKNDIKENSILIDVGTTRVNGNTVGDIDFESCSEKASYITPVPGGVGPMTVAMLLKNTISLACGRKQ
ncbi:bifunctional 5,10-methylenetetrahydrofolate dehydrogenase/5,10-methenyltetrahydrofolate cyclohydrolase [Patescibacteria group bacterium]|nr:bifunctional 5,10-methylenetetrahydrofolate dehydrogenase/5,10-methenyltetrahydrofolate cyclohydrolase [Patescibacteria group bacterium]